MELTDDDFQQCREDFEDAVRAAAQPPHRAFRTLGGHLGAAWELREELLGGQPLIACQRLSAAKRQEVADIVQLARAIPPAAVRGEGADDLAHEAWAELRRRAARYLEP